MRFLGNQTEQRRKRESTSAMSGPTKGEQLSEKWWWALIEKILEYKERLGLSLRFVRLLNKITFLYNHLSPKILSFVVKILWTYNFFIVISRHWENEGPTKNIYIYIYIFKRLEIQIILHQFFTNFLLKYYW